MTYTLKEKAIQIQTEIGIAKQKLTNALNHIRDYEQKFNDHIKSLELLQLAKEVNRREKGK